MSSQPSAIIDPASRLILPPSARGPLVRVARVKWERDPEMSDLIDYFDEPRFHGPKIKSDADRFDLLTVREVQTIQGIIEKCRASFSYAARNFFWITTKSRGDQLFKLWESQELIYQELMRLKSKGLHMKVQILKARQLGCSTLIEGLIAWRSMFFRNVNAVVVSFDAEHAADLFAIMQHVFDSLPWFLKPQCSSREYKDGLKFENPDYDERRKNPGLNSGVKVYGANKRTGVGTGTRISAAHLCFAPGTSVIVHDGFVRRIEVVKPGDGSMDCNGDLTRVVGVHKSSRANEETAEISFWGCYETLVTTLDHRIYTKDGYRQAGDFKSKDTVRFPVRRITNDHTELQIIHQATGGEHHNKENRQTASYLEANYDVGYLFGLYIAEGSIRFNPRGGAASFTFAMDVDETDRVTKAIRKVVGEEAHLRTYRHKNSRTVVIDIYNAGIARFIESNFGSNHLKTVPDWAWQCGEDFCKGILAGYLAGDGHTGKRGTAAVYASSVRLAILIQMRALTASLGYGWTSLHHRPGGLHYGRNCQEIWTMIWCGRVAVEVAKLRGKPATQSARDYGYHWEYSDDKRWIDIQVKKVSRGFSAEFYDLEVESPEHNFCTLSACVANSEFCVWHPDYARDVIEQDIQNALAEDDPEMFAILESTARGAGTYAYRLWNKNVELGEQAEWHPIFMPWFFESTRVLAPPNGWRPEPPEATMNNRVQVDWIRCDNLECQQYQERYHKTADRDGSACLTCNAGTLLAYNLSPSQMYWMQRKRKNAQKEAESMKKLLQEMATTAESAWTLSGTPVFGDGAQEFVDSCVRPPAKEGFLDKAGNLHGCNPKNIRLNSVTNEYYEACYLDGCDQDHQFGDHNGETPYHQWKEVEKDAEYSIGADVSEGLGGEFDFSVGTCIKVNRRGGADEVVAVFRSNLIDPVEFAQVLNFMGRYYNEGQMSIEVNRYDTCMSWIRFQLQYPNLYRWKHMDSLNPLSNKLGWLTNVSSKPRLYQTMKRWLQHKLLIVPSRNFAAELKTFTKDEDERGATAESGSFDDECLSTMIALYCAHEGDWDDSLGQMSIKRELSMESAPWHMSCGACQLLWPAYNNLEKNCPRCGCMVITGKANRDPNASGNQSDAFTDGTISRQEAKDFAVSITEDKGAEEPDYSVPFVCG